jgi:hypothetical protein
MKHPFDGIVSRSEGAPDQGRRSAIRLFFAGLLGLFVPRAVSAVRGQGVPPVPPVPPVPGVPGVPGVPPVPGIPQGPAALPRAPLPGTRALGESGGQPFPTRALDESGGQSFPTRALGESGGQPPVTTMALGEEGSPMLTRPSIEGGGARGPMPMVPPRGPRR